MVDIREARTLIGMAVYFGDNRWIGTVEEVKLPDLSWVSVESGAGIKRETPVPYLETMSATLKISGPSDGALASMAIGPGEQTRFLVRNDTVSARHDGIEVVLGGRVKKYTPPTQKTGEKMETEIELNLDVYTYAVNGTKRIEIDAKQIICVIEGRDLMADTRANL
jgi:P2 family phage contractile tail tube protein